MAGQGGVVRNKWNGFVPPECRSNPEILKLNPQLQWVQAKEPLHQGIDVNATNGIGPGMSFANSLLRKNSSFGMVGLVPCAISGTKIIQWQRGTDFYDQLVNRAKAALRSGGTIRALLWYQGESDIMKKANVDAYEEKLQQFITDVRTDLELPELLIIQVALGSQIIKRKSYTDIVRQAQLNIVIPNVICVDAIGLPLEQDKLHLTTPAQVHLGEMLADAFLMIKSVNNKQLHPSYA